MSALLPLLRQLGWPGLAGVALLAGALLFGQFLLAPLEDRISALDATISRNDRPSSGTRSEQQALDTFYAHFNRKEGITDKLAHIYSAAEDNGLALNHATYRMSPVAKSRLMQYQISIQTNGEYGSVRNFALQILDTMPTATLDSIRFDRQSTTSPLLSAELILSLYLLPSP